MKQDHYLQETKIAKFTTRVYGWMSIGLATTACIAYLVVHSGLYQALLPLWWVWSFITLGIGLGINYALNRLSAATMGTLFITYAVCEGLMFGTILPLFAAAYGGSMIWCAFATAAIIFTVAVIYGIYTKADMSSLGRIFTLGVIALFVLSLAYFIGSFFVPLKGMYLSLIHI